MQSNNNTIIDLLVDDAAESLLASDSMVTRETIATQYPPDHSLVKDSYFMQGGMAIAVILAITFFVEALTKLVKVSREN